MEIDALKSKRKVERMDVGQKNKRQFSWQMGKKKLLNWKVAEREWRGEQSSIKLTSAAQIRLWIKQEENSKFKRPVYKSKRKQQQNGSSPEISPFYNHFDEVLSGRSVVESDMVKEVGEDFGEEEEQAEAEEYEVDNINDDDQEENRMKYT